MSDDRKATMKKSVRIEAPIEEVFSYYTDPTKIPEYMPGMVDVREVEVVDGEPVSFEFTYQMAGMKFDGRSRVLEFEPNHRMVMEQTGGIKSLNVIDFASEQGGTRITEEMSYEIPVPLIGRFAAQFLLKLNENEFETLHANVKARMEAKGVLT